MDKSGYKIVEVIGAGTFGTVFKCADDNNNVCCIKQIKLENSSSDATNLHFEMIQHEIYLLQNLDHPRIIGLHDYFCSDDFKYIHIVMEHASHGPLSKLITERHAEYHFFDEQDIKKFLIDMLFGIEYLHMKNVIHKDLKPCNILMCQNGRLKIADFGVSKITNLDNCDLVKMFKRQTKEAGGSPIYMAPETLIHNRFSFASDIWALGCILYELCTLQAAFGFIESMDDLIRCTLTKEYAPLTSTLPSHTKHMMALSDQMMTVDVNKRSKLKDIISNPMIVFDYYHGYFQFDE